MGYFVVLGHPFSPKVVVFFMVCHYLDSPLEKHCMIEEFFFAIRIEIV